MSAQASCASRAASTAAPKCFARRASPLSRSTHMRSMRIAAPFGRVSSARTRAEVPRSLQRGVHTPRCRLAPKSSLIQAASENEFTEIRIVAERVLKSFSANPGRLIDLVIPVNN